MTQESNKWNRNTRNRRSHCNKNTNNSSSRCSRGRRRHLIGRSLHPPARTNAYLEVFRQRQIGWGIHSRFRCPARKASPRILAVRDVSPAGSIFWPAIQTGILQSLLGQNMKTHEKWILGSLLVLLAASLGAEIFTRSWANYRGSLHATERAEDQEELAYTRPFDTAQQLAPLAVTHTEQEDAQEALRLGDHAVDMAFAAALRDAPQNPVPLRKETRPLAARIETLEEAAVADEERIAELKEKVGKSHDAKAAALQDELDLAEAQLSLDQDDLDDAHQDFERAGGDKHATIQKLLDRYQAAQGQGQTDAARPAAAMPTAPTITSAAANSSVELTKSDRGVTQTQAWLSLHSKEKLLIQARDAALADAASLSVSHDAFEKILDDEKAQKKILPKKAAPSRPMDSTTPKVKNAP